MELELYFILMLILWLFILIKVKTKINRKWLEFKSEELIMISNIPFYAYYTFDEKNENYNFSILLRCKFI